MCCRAGVGISAFSASLTLDDVCCFHVLNPARLCFVFTSLACWCFADVVDIVPCLKQSFDV